jgi:hypothetical protein
MEAYDLSLKLAYAGSRSPIPFSTGPQYTNSVPAAPVLSMVRIFVKQDLWSEENLKIVAREVARVLGATEQYDVGITQEQAGYEADSPAAGVVARLIKLDARDPQIVLLIKDGIGDKTYEARYPRLQFGPTGESFWRSVYAPAAVKASSQP